MTARELPELPPTARTRLYGDDFLELALQRFEREGVWLLVSVHHYGWRAHRDMAALLLSSEVQLEGLGDDLGHHHAEHRAMSALEELFLLLDQIWRVVSGIRTHRGDGTFLEGYRRQAPSVAAEFDALERLTADDWRALFSLPAPNELPEALFERSVIDLRDLGEAREMIEDLTATSVLNMEEVGRLFARPKDAAGAGTRSVRDINNAYRHGTQVVYDDCAPEEIPWRAANPEMEAGLLLGTEEVSADARENTINVLLEGPDEEGHARLASYPRDAVWAADLLRSMENLSVLLHKLVVSFLISEARGGPVVGTLLLDWERLNADQGEAGA